jgi:UTP--glucose-1-phosphate uridylyltransferase
MASLHPADDPRLDRALLARFAFDEEAFRRDVSALRAGQLSPESSLIHEPLSPVTDAVDVVFDGARADEARALGEAALARGEAAVVILNGGMATRFGGVVKGVVEVHDGRSFLAAKAEDVRRASARFGRPVPLVLMNSFATDAATRAHFEEHRDFGLESGQVLAFQQSIAVRLTPEGELFLEDDGQPSYYAPGHGDFFPSIRKSGVLAELARRGVKHLLFSNVDNLGATIDPVVLGEHLRAGAELSVEITGKQRTASGAWDKGGAPALWRGRRALIEGFRFPPSFAQETLPDFSTNTMLFSVQAIDRPLPLARHVVKKKVGERTAVQLESIACEASLVDDEAGQPLLALAFLRVPREGERGRFFPVKEVLDLETMRGALKARLEAGWRLRDG